ncbi:DUF1559 family PulG-like putative transporter [Lignipirellula cremea]|uniref:DUF1559 domain-containing protein n=1 Tax=Lignipirellula cremea TaxID=2528010 RepID=A0A518DQ67_9BACT|nr:DUF1559 domain-containing protein [Lignipirellula cremea]QDU93980.1 hypothetical protein Pla8534_17660 [Lignipirellula cremea]
MLRSLSPLLLASAIALGGCGGQAKKADDKPADPAGGVATAPAATNAPGGAAPAKTTPAADSPGQAAGEETTSPPATVDTSAVSALLKFIPEDTVGFWLVNSQQGLSRPLVKPMLQATGLEHQVTEEIGQRVRFLNIFGYVEREGKLGIVRCQIWEFTSAAEARAGLIRFAEFFGMRITNPSRQVQGFDVFQVGFLVFALRDKVVIHSTWSEYLDRVLAQTGPPAHLKPLIDPAVLASDAMLVLKAKDPQAHAFLLEQATAEIKSAPPSLLPLSALLPKAKMLVAAGSLTEGRLAHLQVEMEDDEAAEMLANFGKVLPLQARQMGLAAIDELGVDPPSAVQLKKTLNALFDGIQLTQEGTTARGVVTAPADVAQWPTALASTLAALKKKNEETIVPQHHIEQIVQAIHDYTEVRRDARQILPPAAIMDQSGKPLLSWRVAILPSLNKELYDQFKLDEPWDSPHNLQLVEKMPAVFGKSTDGRTRFLGFANKGGVFETIPDPERPPFPRSVRFADITDGVSVTIAVVHVAPDKAVPWTKPEDVTYDISDPLAGVGEQPDGKLLVCFLSARSSWIDLNRITKEQFKMLVEYEDDNEIDFDFRAK